jgi:hypothetical protein
MFGFFIVFFCAHKKAYLEVKFKLLAFLSSDEVSQIYVLIVLPTDKTSTVPQIRSECSGEKKWLLYLTLTSIRHASSVPVPFGFIQFSNPRPRSAIKTFYLIILC